MILNLISGWSGQLLLFNPGYQPAPSHAFARADWRPPALADAMLDRLVHDVIRSNLKENQCEIDEKT